MCWNSKKRPELKVAKRNIKVYKILYIKQFYDGNPIYCSPIKPYFWILGETMIEFLSTPTPYKVRGFKHWTYEITSGFCSVTTKPYIEVGEKVDYFSTNKRRLMLHEAGRHIFECELPKGTEYYLNKTGEVISNQLRIIKRCD